MKKIFFKKLNKIEYREIISNSYMEDPKCSLASESWTLHSCYAAEQRTRKRGLSVSLQLRTVLVKKKKKSNIYNSSIIYLTTVTSNGFLAHLQQFYITPDFSEYDIESSNQSDFNHMNFQLADGLRKLSHLWISWNTRTHTRGYHNSMPKKSPPSQVFQFTLSTSEQKHAITVLQEHLGLSTCLSAQHM